MRFLTRVFIAWLPLAVAVTLLCSLVYATVQQNYRQSLNDPQIQMAEDAANSINAGVAPSAVFGGTKAVDIGSSLAPWLAVFDASGMMVVSSGSLDGQAITFPSGVFNTSTWHTYAEYGISIPVPPQEDRFTWQPRSGVREAVVLIKVQSSTGTVFVASGRNMREVENREGALVFTVAIGWIVTLVGTLLIQIFSTYILLKKI